MNHSQDILAQRYAQAYLNVNISAISYKDFRIIREAAQFLEHNKRLLFFLNWPVVTNVEKIETLNRFFDRCQVPVSIHELVKLLAHHKRLFLITKVVQNVCKMYEKRHSIAQVTITTAHPATEQDLKVMQQFLANKTGLSIIYDYKVDKKLIAGVRMQSDTFLWEHSINKQLESIKLPLIR